VFVTHDIDEAIKMGDRIAILRERSVVAQLDTPSRILAYPVDDFVDDFIGSGSTLKGLHFERVRDLELSNDYPFVRSSESRGDTRRLLADSDARFALVLDERGRPERWVDDEDLSRGDPSETVAGLGPKVIAMVEGNATLHDALEAMITSSAGQAVVVGRDGAYTGVVQIEQLTEVIRRMRAEAKAHYDRLRGRA